MRSPNERTNTIQHNKSINQSNLVLLRMSRHEVDKFQGSIQYNLKVNPARGSTFIHALLHISASYCTPTKFYISIAHVSQHQKKAVDEATSSTPEFHNVEFQKDGPLGHLLPDLEGGEVRFASTCFAWSGDRAECIRWRNGKEIIHLIARRWLSI